MTIRTCFSTAFGLLALAAWPVFAASPADAPLKVCVAEHNAPFSSLDGSPKGVDVDVAQAIADRLGRSLQFHWLTVPVRGGLGRAMSQSIETGTCDLFAGLPMADESDDDLAKRGLVASTPYLSAGYALVTQTSSRIKSIEQARAVKIGAVSATPADLYLLKGAFNRAPYADSKALLGALAQGEIAAALVWSASLAVASKPPGIVVRGTVAESWMQTRFAMASRRTDSVLRAAVDDVIRTLKEDGSLPAIAQRNGFP
jgi:polar amino acid transport system substrate-binding protein